VGAEGDLGGAPVDVAPVGGTALDDFGVDLGGEDDELGIVFKRADGGVELRGDSGGDPTVPCIVKDGKYEGSGWGDPPRG
jgi:hypothetical protein